MAKKIRLIDDEATTETSAESATSAAVSNVDGDKMMKYAEAIDWKLWEILKLLRTQVGEE
jgi:hypothetical protein